MFAFRETRGTVEVAFTDRHGGVSTGPAGSLNLAVPRGDDAGEIGANLDRVAHAFARGYDDPQAPFDLPVGVPVPVVVGMQQVHGADVHVVTEDALRGAGEPAAADGLVTAVPGVVLLVRVADCAPVLLADVEQHVVAAVHAGRPGLASGVVPRAVEVLREHGAGRLTAWIGPHVCGRCYEVPDTMRADVAGRVPEAFAETSWGTPSLDLGAGLRAQLAAADVTVADLGAGWSCTRENEDLYSYRRQGQGAGRFAGLVWVRP